MVMVMMARQRVFVSGSGGCWWWCGWAGSGGGGGQRRPTTKLTPPPSRLHTPYHALNTTPSKKPASYGVWGDWAEPYVTLDPAYEAAQLRVFGAMVLNGHVYRGRKPVHW